MPAMSLPQIPRELTRLDDLRLALKRDETLAGVLVASSDISMLRAKAINITESKLEKVNAAEADLEKLGLLDVELIHSDLTATNCADASWLRVRLQNIRCSGLKLQTSSLKDVVFEDCKLNLANFRFTKLKNVIFKDCALDEADFYMAELENVQFQTSVLNKTEFSSTKLKNVDLRSSDLTAISGLSGLAGAIIDHVQLISLAPLLAMEHHIEVRDD